MTNEERAKKWLMGSSSTVLVTPADPNVPAYPHEQDVRALAAQFDEVRREALRDGAEALARLESETSQSTWWAIRCSRPNITGWLQDPREPGVPVLFSDDVGAKHVAATAGHPMRKHMEDGWMYEAREYDGGQLQAALAARRRH